MELGIYHLEILLAVFINGAVAKHVILKQPVENRDISKFRLPEPIDLHDDFELEGTREKRYIKQGSQWFHNEVTWNVPSNGWSKELTRSEANRTLTKAFRTWAEVCPLVFRWADPPAQVDITVKFVIGSHGDEEDFDGPGHRLAHAFYPSAPNFPGDIHFDDSESWTTSSRNGSYRLLAIAVHEIGHSLGLRHSPVKDSVMHKYYSVVPKISSVVLSDDDVNGIQDIYGLCNPTVTAIESRMGDRKTYIFSADNFWRLDDAKSGSDRDYPLKISSKWKGVPDNIDEIFLWGHNWQVYFFKGSEYYRYNDINDAVDANYPQPISQGWPGLPADGIDAGFTWSDFNSYFFRGNLVYKYDNDNDQVVSGYPKKITDTWPGLPDNLDSAFRWYYDGNTYFFKDEFYWKWNDAFNNATGPFLILDSWKNICNV